MVKNLCLPLVATLLLPFAAYAEEGPIALDRGFGVQVEPAPGRSTVSSGPARSRVVRDVDDFAEVGALGFDFVRLDVGPGPLAVADDGLRNVATAQLEDAVRAFNDMKLRVIVRLRPPRGLTQDPIVYRRTVASVARMLGRIDSPKNALWLSSELKDRPCNRREAPDWEAALPHLIEEAREAAPALNLVLSGVCDDIDGLVRLDPAKFDGSRLIFGFSFFEPESFTQQGVGDARDVKGVPWPADDVAVDLAMIYTKLLLSAHDLPSSEHAARVAHVRRHIAIYLAGDWNERQIEAQFTKLSAWAKKHLIGPDRLLLGGFGVVAATDESGGALVADRSRWLAEVRREAEARGIAWAVQTRADTDLIAMDALGMPTSAAVPQETGSLPGRTGP